MKGQIDSNYPKIIYWSINLINLTEIHWELQAQNKHFCGPQRETTIIVNNYLKH